MIEPLLACEGPTLRLYDEVLGKPILGIVVEKELEVPIDGDCECPGLLSVGGCASDAIAARYWMTFLVLSVFPAPDSPLDNDSSVN